MILPSRCRWAQLSLLLAGIATLHASAQWLPGAGPEQTDPYSARRTWALFSEYSPTSSHIILGVARQREFVTLGAAFTRRMREGRHWDLSYLGEIRPLMAESDPVMTGYSYNINLPAGNGVPAVQESGSMQYARKLPVLEIGPKSEGISFTYMGQNYYFLIQNDYGRRWTYLGGMSPLGLQATLLKHRRLQGVLMANGGFAASARDLPLFDTSAGNFTFAFGGGVELVQGQGRSLRVEYRLQHFSNAHVGPDPGIDSQMLHFAYIWKR